MTEESNRERVLDFLNVLYSGEVEAALERCTDDIEFLANAPIDLLPHMGHRRGEGDKVAAFIRVFLRKSINQRMVQFDIAGFYTLRGGKICQIREIIDTFDLVQQLVERDVAAILTGRRPNPI